MPYSFVVKSTKDPTSDISIARDIYHSVIQPGHVSVEESCTVRFAPQAVFRVRIPNRCSAAVSGHGEAILCTQFAPGSSARLATGSGDNTARIWDCDTGTPLSTLKGHSSWVLVVAYSPDGSLLATGSMDKTVRLWDATTGALKGKPLKGHMQWIRAISWEPYHLQKESQRLASASKDCTVRVWDAQRGVCDMVLAGHKGSVSCVRWGGTGYIYSSSQDKTIKIWNSESGSLLATLSAHAHWVNHLALSTDFALRTAYHDHTGNIPAAEEQKRAAAQTRFDAAARDGDRQVERVVSASDDFTIYLWQPKLDGKSKEKPLARLLGHQKQVNQVVFSPDGRLLASAAFDNHVKLWRASDGQFLFSLRAHVGPVYMTCFSADSRSLVSASKDTTIKVWDVKTGMLTQDLPGHKDFVYAVDWAPDGARIASGGKDKAVRIWRA